MANQSENAATDVTLTFEPTHNDSGEKADPVTTTIASVAGGASQTVQLDWNTDGLTPGKYDLPVTAETLGDVDDTDDAITGRAELVNALTIAGLSPKTATVVIGNDLDFAVEIRNLGTDALSDVFAGLYETHAEVPAATATIESIAAGGTATATLKWNTTGQIVDNRSLVVAVAADGQESDNDDWQWVTVHLRNPVVLDAATVVTTRLGIGNPVTIAAQVRNAGPAAVSNVAVDLYPDDDDDDEAVASATIDNIAAGATATANLVWDTDDLAAGEHSLRVATGLAGYASDVDDAATIAITLEAPAPDIGFDGNVAAPEVAVIGNKVQVDATLANEGNAPASAEVALYVDTATEPVVTTPAKSIPPGATESFSLEWDTDAWEGSVGEYQLRLAANVSGDVDNTNNEATSSVSLFNSAFDAPNSPDECFDDVGVSLSNVSDFDTVPQTHIYFSPGETVLIDYEIYNYSCDKDVTVDVDLNADKTEVAIGASNSACLDGCLIPAGGVAEEGATWQLPGLPKTDDETVTATVTVSSPDDFPDGNADNNTATSSDSINIANPDDIDVKISDADANKGLTKSGLAKREFGTTNLCLNEASVEPTTLPYYAATMSVNVEATNKGNEAAPVSVEVTPEGLESLVPHAPAKMIPGDSTKSVTFGVPTNGLTIDTHTVNVKLAAVNNISECNNEITFTVTRLAPPVIRVVNDVEIVSIASAPVGQAMQGQWVEITVTVRNNGSSPVNAQVELTFPSDVKLPERKSPRVPPGGTATASFTWKTRNYEPGTHTLRAAILLDDNATAGDTTAELQFRVTPPVITAAILDVSTRAEPQVQQPAVSGGPVVGEPVTIAVAVRNDGPIAANIPVTLHFPSADKKPETRSPRVAAGKTGVATFTWRTSNYAPGVHAFTVVVGGASRDFTIELLPPSVDFTVSQLSAPSSSIPIVKGDAVPMAATVQNLGPYAGKAEVAFQDAAQGKPMRHASVSMEPGDVQTVEFAWQTRQYPPGDYQLQATATAKYDVNPDNDASDVQTVAVLTDRDVTLGFGEGTRPIYAHGGMSALNFPPLGRSPMTDIIISPTGLDSGLPPAVVSGAMSVPNIPPLRQSPATDAAINPFGSGATLLPSGVTGAMFPPNIPPLRQSPVPAMATNLDGLSVASHSPHFAGALSRPYLPSFLPARRALSIVDIMTTPAAPVVGQPVTVTVTVRNDGSATDRIPVTLHFPSPDKQPETRRPRVASGETAAVTFTWRTGGYSPGTHTFRVETPEGSRQFTLGLRAAVFDAAIVGIGANPAGSASRGQPVEVWVAVRNNGPVAVRVPVQLAFPSASKKPERRSPWVSPGETARVSFTWKTSNYAPGVHTLTATLLTADHAGVASAELQLLLTAPVVTAAIQGVSSRPASPVVGESVAITVTVRNDGPAAASIPVTLHFPSPDKQPETRRPRVASGATGTAGFTWRTSRYRPGWHEFRVEIGTDPPTSHRFTVELLRPVADFTVVDIYPPPASYPVVKGDWVEVAAFVRNLGPHAGRATIDLYNETHRKTMYSKSVSLKPGESRVVEFTWKTLRYDEGEHRIRAQSQASYDSNTANNRSPAATVSVLNNRDVTFGFGNNVIPDAIAGAIAKPSVRAAARYPDAILITDAGAPQTGGLGQPAPGVRFGVAPGQRAEPGAAAPVSGPGWSAPTSAAECARLQARVGESQPRAVLCPNAPALVR